jgi:hypothetical protein
MKVWKSMERHDATAGTLGAALYQYPLMITLLALGGLGVGALLASKLSQMTLPAR